MSLAVNQLIGHGIQGDGAALGGLPDPDHVYFYDDLATDVRGGVNFSGTAQTSPVAKHGVARRGGNYSSISYGTNLDFSAGAAFSFWLRVVGDEAAALESGLLYWPTAQQGNSTLNVRAQAGGTGKFDLVHKVTTTQTLAVELAVDTWHHCVHLPTGAGKGLYVNGTKHALNASPPFSQYTGLYVQSGDTFATAYWALDELYVWRASLSEAQAENLWNGGSPERVGADGRWS